MLVEEELSISGLERDTLLTIGVFDGVHLGHRFLIEKLNKKATAEGLSSGVITFKQHPRLLFSTQPDITYLTSIQERIRLLKKLGVAYIVPLSFTPELSQLKAREFIELLKRYLRMKGLVVGPDFALGRGREGDTRTLAELGKELSFTVEGVVPQKIHGEVVSSTLIRESLSRGDITKVNSLLGRYFALAGQVAQGDRRGKSLGFPTANLIPDQSLALPADGVYAANTIINNDTYNTVINIGVRPTFDGEHRLIEAYLLDFSGDLYGQEIRLELIQRLRGEQKFSNIEDLKAQMVKDVAHTRSLLDHS